MCTPYQAQQQILSHVQAIFILWQPHLSCFNGTRTCERQFFPHSGSWNKCIISHLLLLRSLRIVSSKKGPFFHLKVHRIEYKVKIRTVIRIYWPFLILCISYQASVTSTELCHLLLCIRWNNSVGRRVFYGIKKLFWYIFIFFMFLFFFFKKRYVLVQANYFI